MVRFPFLIFIRFCHSHLDLLYQSESIPVFCCKWKLKRTPFCLRARPWIHPSVKQSANHKGKFWAKNSHTSKLMAPKQVREMDYPSNIPLLYDRDTLRFCNCFYQRLREGSLRKQTDFPPVALRRRKYRLRNQAEKRLPWRHRLCFNSDQ